mmetsp:Transcript_136706/g.380973  ORF Transcript_136706/g.380973 Transcript_136706/m.380973 type:complete len:356 (-) Transcript_136706:75-1142(-)
MAPLPPTPETIWEEADQLVGEGDRTVKVAFVDVPVYRVSFYINVTAAAEALSTFAGHSHEELSADPTFFVRLTQGRFRKTFRFLFLRRIPKAKASAAFREALASRVGLDCLLELEQFVSVFTNIAEHDVLTLRLDADGERVEVDATWREPPSLAIQSSAIWLGLQQIYFDERTDMPLVKVGAIRHLSEIVFGAAAGHLQPQETDCLGTDMALSADTAVSGRRTWREFAQRTRGKDGYRVGDLTRGILARARNKQLPREDVKPVERRDEQVYLEEIAQLRLEVEREHEREREAERQRWASFRTGSFLGAALGLLAALLLDATLVPELERPVGLSLCAVLACSALLTSRWQPNALAS